MLSRVKIQNFKSIGEPGVDLELKPLTFLVGPNGGGKSSILEAVTFASKQGTAASGFFVFSDIEDLHFRAEANTLSVEIAAVAGRSDEIGTYKLSCIGASCKPEFLPARPKRRIELEGNHEPKADGSQIMRQVLFDKVYPIKATRGVVPQARTPREPIWVGGDGEYTLDILEKLPDPHYRRQKSGVSKWASVFGVSDVATSHVTTSEIAGGFADDRLDTPLNLYLASSGSKQVLPVVVQLFWADPGAIVTIEEPEISLHPKAQLDVLEMFAEAIKEDKQIIATTHSLFMMQGIGYAVHKGWLEPDQVAVYHVEKKKGTGTESKRLPLSEKGYIKGWVPSFAKVEGQLLREWTKNLPEE